ncbi:MAG: hypothetical protein ACLFVP_09140 [Candidatus Bathyarchaeia archaeon]
MSLEVDEGIGKSMAAYSAVIGVLYMLAGLLEISIWTGLNPPIIREISILLNVAGDVFAGFVLIVIGLVYIWGIGELLEGDQEGVSYLAVGSLLSTTLFLLCIAYILSNGLGSLLGFEGWLGWRLLDEVSPGMIIWFLAAPLLYLVWLRGRGNE